MALNTYFNNYRNSGEQRLFENLIIESIRIYGKDVLYLPRKRENFDSLYGADDQSSYNFAIPLEMYVKTYDGFTGDGAFMSKFNLEIRDSITFTVAKRRFNETVGEEMGMSVPHQGDLIWFPMIRKLFTIMDVDYKPFFYQLNELQTYDLVCEMFEYSDQVFNTGIKEIDALTDKYSQNMRNNALYDELGRVLLNEDYYYLTRDHPEVILEKNVRASDNKIVQTEADLIIDFSDFPPQIDRTY